MTVQATAVGGDADGGDDEVLMMVALSSSVTALLRSRVEVSDAGIFEL